MVTTVEAKIADLLLERVSALEFSPPFPIAYPGLGFTPPAETYLEAHVIPNTTVTPYLSDSDPDRFQGILQVTVVAPGNVGVVGPMEVAGRVASQLAKSRMDGQGVSVRIEERPSLAPPMQDADRLRIPVSARYRIEA